MTKHPIKHTMEFEEETCPGCAGIPYTPPCPHPGCYSHITHPCEECGRIQGVCQICHGKGTIPLATTFDLVKDCPECGGLGYDDDLRDKDYLDSESCLNCSDNGLPAGKVHRYWTMKEATAKMGEGWEWPEDTQVYRRVVTPQGHKTAWKLCYYWSCLVLEPWQENILHIFGQPAPPADYTLEESK